MLKIIKFLLFSTCVLSTASLSQGEEINSNPEQLKSKNVNEQRGDFLPGEEVKTPTGQIIKVWSTASPQKLEDAPKPPSSNDYIAKDINIILDKRHRFKPETVNER